MWRSTRLAVFLLLAIVAGPRAMSATREQAAALHPNFSRLLSTYVHDNLVDYEAWSANADDEAALARYIADLAALDPADWPRQEALAYWLNLYNAVTVKLILDHYPLDSIKDIGGFMKKSPWKRDLVTVAGKPLTLNNIEHDVIRPTFGDPRIHFALNCASLGCPPLGAAAFDPDQLSAQLDAACRLALNRERWVRVDGDEVSLTKIFDWYGQDFQVDGGTVLTFIRNYRTEPFPDGEPKVRYMSYDWQLNRVPAPDRSAQRAKG